jgi:hypothetical protein
MCFLFSYVSLLPYCKLVFIPNISAASLNLQGKILDVELTGVTASTTWDELKKDVGDLASKQTSELNELGFKATSDSCRDHVGQWKGKQAPPTLTSDNWEIRKEKAVKSGSGAKPTIFIRFAVVPLVKAVRKRTKAEIAEDLSLSASSYFSSATSAPSARALKAEKVKWMTGTILLCFPSF